MKSIHEVRLKLKPNKTSLITEIVLRFEGVDRKEVQSLANSFHPDYEIFYIIAGPRNEVDD